MESRDDLHRITVGNVQDWHKICSNYRRAMLATLHSQIQENDLSHESDALVAHIDQVRPSLYTQPTERVYHFIQFIDRTFSVARPNLRVNGQNFESLDENGRGANELVSSQLIFLQLLSEMEAFDETLDRRIWSLADNRIKWHTLIAERRRKIPMETERTVATWLGNHHKPDTDVLPALPGDEDAEGEIAYEQDGRLLSSASFPPC